MRIRTIKPSFWRSDDITGLPMDLRLLFIGLWSYVDDNGVGLDDYRQITADLFALEEDQTATRKYVRDGLAILSRGLLIYRYKIENGSYIFVVAWDRHQRVDRPNKARYPRPPEGFDPSTSGNDQNPDQASDQVATVSRQARETPPSVVRKRGRGEEGNKTLPAAAENLTQERARKVEMPPQNEETPMPSIPEPPPGRGITGPTAGDAYRLVDSAIGREHPHAVRTALAMEVGTLLLSGTDKDLVFSALTLWLTKPHLGPRSLPNLVSEAIRVRNRPAPGSRPSTTDQRVADMQALKKRFMGAPNLRALPGGA